MNVFTPRVIQVLPPRKCELCGKTAECRPYGPGGRWVCYPCGMKNEEEVKRQLKQQHGI